MLGDSFIVHTSHTFAMERRDAKVGLFEILFGKKCGKIVLSYIHFLRVVAALVAHYHCFMY